MFTTMTEDAKANQSRSQFGYWNVPLTARECARPQLRLESNLIDSIRFKSRCSAPRLLASGAHRDDPVFARHRRAAGARETLPA